MSRTISDEARELAGVSRGLNLGDEASFTVDLPFHGQEQRVIEGAQNILSREAEGHITFSVNGKGSIHIQA